MHLAFITLKILDKSEQSGYSLAKAIEKETNWKPSYGSLYPMLSFLKKKGLVKCKASGRQKVYSITPAGMKKLKEFENDRESFAHDMEKKVMIMSKCFGDKPSFFKFMFKMIKSGKMPFGSITPQALEFRNTLMHLVETGKLEKNKEKISRLLDNVLKELKKI